jgi:hypothetical protein
MHASLPPPLLARFVSVHVKQPQTPWHRASMNTSRVGSSCSYRSSALPLYPASGSAGGTGTQRRHSVCTEIPTRTPGPLDGPDMVVPGYLRQGFQLSQVRERSPCCLPPPPSPALRLRTSVALPPPPHPAFALLCFSGLEGQACGVTVAKAAISPTKYTGGVATAPTQSTTLHVGVLPWLAHALA